MPLCDPEYLVGGAVEQDPDALLDSVLNAGRKAVAQAGVPVAAVALANQGETVLAWDRGTGAPLTPAVVWQDRRAETICAARSASASGSRPRTGLVLDPYFSAPKMAWIRANMTTDGVVTTTDTWLVHRLCGAFVTDASTASRSLLLDLDSAPVGRRAARPVRPRPARRCPRSSASDADRRHHRRFGGDVPVSGLIVDQQAALLAEGCLTPGRQVHVRHRRVPARPARRQRPPPGHRVGADHLGRLAVARAPSTTASTGRSTRPPPRSAGSPTSG